MTRNTSIDTYNAIKENGLLGRWHFEVYSWTFKFGPGTSAEIFNCIKEHGKGFSPLSQSRARFTELRDMGVLCEVGQRPCKITGRNAIVWDVTDRLPIKPEKRLSRAEKEYQRGFEEGRKEGYSKAIQDGKNSISLQGSLF